MPQSLLNQKEKKKLERVGKTRHHRRRPCSVFQLDNGSMQHDVCGSPHDGCWHDGCFSSAPCTLPDSAAAGQEKCVQVLFPARFSSPTLFVLRERKVREEISTSVGIDLKRSSSLPLLRLTFLLPGMAWPALLWSSKVSSGVRYSQVVLASAFGSGSGCHKWMDIMSKCRFRWSGLNTHTHSQIAI